MSQAGSKALMASPPVDDLHGIPADMGHLDMGTLNAL